MKSLPLRCLFGCIAVLLLQPTTKAAPGGGKLIVHPPPGLYRVDSEATIEPNFDEHPEYVSRHVLDGASGNETITYGRVGKKQVIVQASNEGPITQCITAQQVNDGRPPPGVCKGISAMTGPDSARSTGSCDGFKFDVTYKKIDEKTWERRALVHQYAVAPVPTAEQPYITHQRKILTAQMKSASTVAGRTEAAAQLAQFEAGAAEMKKSAAELADAQSKMAKELGQGMASKDGAAMVYTIIGRLTRIADKCTAAGK